MCEQVIAYVLTPVLFLQGRIFTEIHFAVEVNKIILKKCCCFYFHLFQVCQTHLEDTTKLLR